MVGETLPLFIAVHFARVIPIHDRAFVTRQGTARAERVQGRAFDFRRAGNLF